MPFLPTKMFVSNRHVGPYLYELTVVSVEKGVGSADGAVGCQCAGRGGAGVVADITPPVAGDGWDTNHKTWTSHLQLLGMAGTQTMLLWLIVKLCDYL